MSPENESYYYATTVAPDNTVYAAGKITGTSLFHCGDGVKIKGPYEGSNIILVKYDDRGRTLWARSMSSAGHDSTFVDLAVSPDNAIYAAGWTSQFDAYDRFRLNDSVEVKGAYKVGDNAMLVKYDPDGNSLWARTTTEASFHSNFFGVAAGGDGSVYVTAGLSKNETFAFGNGTTFRGRSKRGTTVLLKYDPSGLPQWIKPVESDDGFAFFTHITADSGNALYVSGTMMGTGSYDFPPALKVSGNHPGNNLFLARYDLSGNAHWVVTASQVSGDTSHNAAAAGNDGAIYAVGTFKENAKLDPGNSITLTGAGEYANAFIVKYSMPPGR
jgi:hypothetical protein